jgi:hypothetical protein
VSSSFDNYQGHDHFQMALTLFGYIEVREQLNILNSLCDEIKEEELRTSLENAMTRVRSMSEKRNKIAHAQWGTLDGEEARFWRGLTSEHLRQISSGSKPTRRTDNVFTLAEIITLTVEATKLRDELHTILIQATISSLPSFPGILNRPPHV